jgi:hypothetical protein
MGDANAKVGKETAHQPTIGRYSQHDRHSNLFSPELRCFVPVSAHPNFIAYFGGEFANIEVRWLISALCGWSAPVLRCVDFRFIEHFDILFFLYAVASAFQWKLRWRFNFVFTGASALQIKFRCF